MDSSIIQGPVSVAPCQTLVSRFATFSSPYAYHVRGPRVDSPLVGWGCVCSEADKTAVLGELQRHQLAAQRVKAAARDGTLLLLSKRGAVQQQQREELLAGGQDDAQRKVSKV